MLPVFPLLASASLDVTPGEELRILLPDVSEEVVLAFVCLIYGGEYILPSSGLATKVEEIRDLMASLGLHSPASSWTVQHLSQVGEEVPDPDHGGQVGERNEEMFEEEDTPGEIVRDVKERTDENHQNDENENNVKELESQAEISNKVDNEEEEELAMLNSSQQIVNNEHQPEPDHIEQPDDSRTDPIYETEVKTKPKVVKKKKKVSKKYPSSRSGDGNKRKKYACAHCPTMFFSRQGRQIHLNIHHPQLTEHPQCPFCEERIGKYSRSWTVHLSTQHLQEKENPLYREIIERIGIKKFTCKECGRDFTTNISLEHHMVGTHNSHANTIRCDQCGKFFKSFETLDKHKRLLHDNSFRNHLCGHCSKILKRKADLIDHVQRHHSDKKFPCQECGKTFSTNKDLLKHIRRNHTEREKCEQCGQCELKFYDVEGLRNHVISVHDKVKPWYCEVCQFKSARLGNLNEHRRKTHSEGNITRKMLIEMVEKDLHPFYVRKDLAMIKLSHI